MSLSPPGPVAVRAADDALANIGVLEDGPPYENSGRYVNIYLASVGLDPGEPWCAAFVHFREVTAAHVLGVSMSGFPRSGAAADYAEWAREHGRWFSADSGELPMKGDLCCFDIPSEGGIHHIGIVLGGDGGGFDSLEANTHPQGEVTRDGFGVFQRRRGYAELGATGGFVRLGW